MESEELYANISGDGHFQDNILEPETLDNTQLNVDMASADTS